MSGRGYIQGINTQRIKWAIDNYNTTPDKFGDNLKIDKFSQKLENNEFSFLQLQKISEALGYGVLFFMEVEPPKEDKIHSIHYRTLSNQNIPFDNNLAKLVKRVEKHRQIYLSLIEELGTPLIPFEPPALTGSIAEKSQTVRNWLGLSLDSKYKFEEYKERIIEKGLLVFQSAGYFGKWKVKNNIIDGFAIYHQQSPIIFITKGNDEFDIFKSKTRQSFTLFHELAHILLHKQDRIDNTDTIYKPSDPKEQEANQFAGYCLVPDNLLKNLDVPQQVAQYYEKFHSLAEKLGISVEVIVRRLSNSGKIKPENYNAYTEWYNENISKYIKKSKGGNRHRDREPLHLFGKPYVNTVLSALEEKHITLNKASDYLDGLKINHLKKLQEHLYG